MMLFFFPRVFWRKSNSPTHLAPLINSRISKLGKSLSPSPYKQLFQTTATFFKFISSPPPCSSYAESIAIFGENRSNKVRILPPFFPLQMHLAASSHLSHLVGVSILPAQDSPFHFTISSVHSGPSYVCPAHHGSLCIQHSAWHIADINH